MKKLRPGNNNPSDSEHAAITISGRAIAAGTPQSVRTRRRQKAHLHGQRQTQGVALLPEQLQNEAAPVHDPREQSDLRRLHIHAASYRTHSPTAAALSHVTITNSSPRARTAGPPIDSPVSFDDSPYMTTAARQATQTGAFLKAADAIPSPVGRTLAASLSAVQRRARVGVT